MPMTRSEAAWEAYREAIRKAKITYEEAIDKALEEYEVTMFEEKE